MSKLKFRDLFAGLGDIAKPKELFFVITHQNNVNNLYISWHSHEQPNTEQFTKVLYLYEVRCGGSCKKGKLVKD